LKSTGIESPIEWAEVQAPTDMRKFVTFVNPSLQKGAMLFARLADLSGQSRPDIPLFDRAVSFRRGWAQRHCRP